MNADGDRIDDLEEIRYRDRRLLRKLAKLLELTDYGEAEKLRVVGAVERELDAMAEEALERRGGAV
jgi:hypothetical protein